MTIMMLHGLQMHLIFNFTGRRSTQFNKEGFSI